MLISFANQKGGVGKSTLAQIVATHLYLVKRKNVIIVDCDPQQSLFEERKRDLIRFKREYPDIELSKVSYPIIPKYPADFPNFYKDELSEIEYVIADFPGSLDLKGVVASFILCDTIFVPFDFVSTKDIAVSKAFIADYKEKTNNLREKIGMPAQKIYGIGAKIQTNVTQYKEFVSNKKMYETAIGIPILDNILPVVTNLKRDSTTIDSMQDTKGNTFDGLCNEILNKL
jgi:cellulose biosynthesis protein BcsQ